MQNSVVAIHPDQKTKNTNVTKYASKLGDVKLKSEEVEDRKGER